MSEKIENSFWIWIKKNMVFVIAFIAALITSFIVPLDKKYFDYFDFKTLTCLFCVLSVVNAFRNIHFFDIIAKKIVCKFINLRSTILALVFITLIASMFIANDMALLTFLPLGYFVLTFTNKQHYMAFTFIMQCIAADLGGMLTPFGNPQNLYLYTYFHIGNIEFMKIMFLPFIISIVLIAVCCLFIKPEPLTLNNNENKTLPIKKSIIYTLLFIFSILIVFRFIPYIWGLFIVPISLLFLDKKALKQVDYPLLFTFAAFFVFSGNMSRIDAVSNFLGSLVNSHTLLVGTLSSQLISNVPSAILLSRFTENYPQLLVAVNIGGVGTLIASLASLITFREYTKNNPGKTWYYLKMFSFYNFGFLIILFIICALVMT
ncbi:MAG: SLC13 family permease [Candidatus Cloacimonetes bacterium]|nr:SLC13 family permease [Candidatus Cloacimonadota bacterium]